MTDIVDMEAERRRRAMLITERETADEEAHFEAGVDLIIDAMVAAQLSLDTTLTAACVAIIDLLEINGYSRADAIQTVAKQIGMFRVKKVK